MRMLTGIGASFALVVAFVGVRDSLAAPKQSPKQVKSDCAKSGGTYMSPSAHGVYGCMNKDTSGIVCGGTGGYANTCSVFKQAPPHLPTQDEVLAFEKAKAKTN